jgi:hypothetical protein
MEAGAGRGDVEGSKGSSKQVLAEDEPVRVG